MFVTQTGEVNSLLLISFGADGGERETCTERHRETDRQTQTQTQTYIETDRRIERQTHGETDIQRDRRTERQREKEKLVNLSMYFISELLKDFSHDVSLDHRIFGRNERSMNN